MNRFITAGILLTTAFAVNSFGDTILPGETIVLYFSSYTYTETVNSPGSISDGLAPLLPNLANFDAEAYVASYGGSIDTTLFTYSGTFELDLGTTVLDGTDPIDDPGDVFGYSSAVPISPDEQQALFNQTCPYFETYGYPASECTGWFQADVTNTGTVPIDFLQETFVGLDGKWTFGSDGVGIFSVAAGALPDDAAQFPDSPPDSSPVPEPGSLSQLLAGSVLVAVLRRTAGLSF